MNRTLLFVITGFLMITYSTLHSQERFPSYYSQNDMELATPGTIIFGLGGYLNPATLSYLSQPNLYFTWNDQNSDLNDFNNFGLFASLPNFGFSFVDNKTNGYSITDYKLSTAFGSESFSLGIGYGWSSGDVSYYNRSNLFTLGAIYRPANFLSFSLIGNLPANNEREGIIGVGVRPFGNYNLTFFGDYIFTQDTIPEEYYLECRRYCGTNRWAKNCWKIF
ncbi:MAG: hypothetical protein MZV64_53900 [Ignavibacteriales bacterium]|nr:hypothetical protein [Ignavibacteriales bacterium]